MLTIYHLVWGALLWLLAHPEKIGLKRVAMIALIAGALPRTLIAILRLPTAWLQNGFGIAELIAFEVLTVLWLIFLTLHLMGRVSTASKLALPMLILAAIECVGVLAAAAGFLSALVQGALARSWWKTTAGLVYGVAQVWYLRGIATQSATPEPHWNRL